MLIEKAGSKEQPKSFTFDSVYAPDTPQRTLYDESAFPLVESVLEGYNGTIFAYGQTNSGKTYTMFGDDVQDEEMRGIIPRIGEQIFS